MGECHILDRDKGVLHQPPRETFPPYKTLGSSSVITMNSASEVVRAFSFWGKEVRKGNRSHLVERNLVCVKRRRGVWRGRQKPWPPQTHTHST